MYISRRMLFAAGGNTLMSLALHISWACYIHELYNVVISLPTIDTAQLIHSICLRPIRKIPVIENLLSISVTLYFMFFFICDSFWNDWWYLKFFNTMGFFRRGEWWLVSKILSISMQRVGNFKIRALIQTALHGE